MSTFENVVTCLIILHCAVPEKTMEIHKNSKGEGGGGSKAEMFKGKYEAKPEFPGGGGGGLQTKTPLMGGVWIFSATTQ